MTGIDALRQLDTTHGMSVDAAVLLGQTDFGVTLEPGHVYER